MSILMSLFLLPVSAQASTTPLRNEAWLAFQQLSALAGEWQGQNAHGGIVRVSYKLIANGHTLVESWDMGGGRTSMTVYHRNGDALLATHYCPLGNQPRLKLAPAATPGQIAFEFLDATNLGSPSNEHADSLRFDLKAKDRFVRIETYRAGETTTESRIILERSATKS